MFKVLHFKNYGEGKEDAEGKVRVKRSTHHGAKDSSEIRPNFCAGGSQVVNLKLQWTPEDKQAIPFNGCVCVVLICSIMLDSLRPHGL